MDGSKQLGRGGAAGGEAPPSTQAPSSSEAAATARRAAAGEDDEVDDEQVERFYALLANIRAMRGVYGAACVDGDGDGGETDDGGGAARRKRARRAEPPWRPVFRMEDFDEPSPLATDVVARRPDSRIKHGDEADGEDSGLTGARPAVAGATRGCTARRHT